LDRFSGLSISKKNFIQKHKLSDLHSRYNHIEQIDKGTSGIIYRAMDRQYKVLCAIKVIQLPSGVLGDPVRIDNELLNEFRVLKELDHPNIVRLIEMFRDE